MDVAIEAQGLKELLAGLKPSDDIVIFLAETAARDSMAAALSFFLSLQADPLNRTVKVVYPKPPTVAWSNLIGINKVIQQVGSKNFIISLDYVEGSIEKVSYNIEGNKFNLVIEPKAGTEMFSEKNVHYNYTGLNAGVIVTIGAATLEGLGKNYLDNKKIFDEKPIVAIDNNPTHKQYGKINIVRPASSLSEIMTYLIKTAQFPLNSDIATNLYDGLLSGSRNFMVSTVTASTFESAAYLLRNNARKPQTSGILRNEELPRQEGVGVRGEEEKQLPPDWLKPKIYKGGSSLL